MLPIKPAVVCIGVLFASKSSLFRVDVKGDSSIKAFGEGLCRFGVLSNLLADLTDLADLDWLRVTIPLVGVGFVGVLKRFCFDTGVRGGGVPGRWSSSSS